MSKKRNDDALYDERVNYNELEQHEYDDAKGQTFYTCPVCGGEYLATFISNVNGRTMCIDCENK